MIKKYFRLLYISLFIIFVFISCSLYNTEELNDKEEALNYLVKIAGALHAYKNDYGDYPRSVDGIGRTKDLKNLTTPHAYLPKLEKDPFGQNYQYMAYPPSYQEFKELYGDYVLFSYGFDKKRDTFPTTYKEFYIRNGVPSEGDFLVRHSYSRFLNSLEE